MHEVEDWRGQEGCDIYRTDAALPSLGRCHCGNDFTRFFSVEICQVCPCETRQQNLLAIRISGLFASSEHISSFSGTVDTYQRILDEADGVL